jgi:ketosteroid isomerase-like protein
MNKFVIVFFLSFACFGQQKESEVKKEIVSILESWHKAAADAKYEDYFSLMTDDAVFIGTDTRENWQNEAFKAYAKPHFDKGKAWSFTTIQRNIYLNETSDFAWFDELLKTQMGICRGSGVLKKTDNDWKISHYVLSITIPNEKVKEVIDLKKKDDDLFIQTLKQ